MEPMLSFLSLRNSLTKENYKKRTAVDYRVLSNPYPFSYCDQLSYLSYFGRKRIIVNKNPIAAPDT